MEIGIVPKNRDGYCEVAEDLLVNNLAGQMNCDSPLLEVVLRCYCITMGNPPMGVDQPLSNSIMRRSSPLFGALREA